MSGISFLSWAIFGHIIVMIIRALLPLTLALALVTPVWADDEVGDASADEPRIFDGESCFETADIAKTLRKMETLKPEKRDRVGMSLKVTFEDEDGMGPPEGLELRDSGTATSIAINADGESEEMAGTVAATSETAELCILDQKRAGTPVEDLQISIDIGMGVRFLDTPGTHSMVDLKDGLKDGRSHYKKMAGAIGFIIPKFTHIAVAGPDEDNPPRVFAVKGGTDIGEPEFEPFQNSRMIAYKALEAMDADGIRVEGEYRITPSPDAKTVRKFMGGGDEPAENEKSEPEDSDSKD